MPIKIALFLMELKQWSNEHVYIAKMKAILIIDFYGKREVGASMLQSRGYHFDLPKIFY